MRKILSSSLLAALMLSILPSVSLAAFVAGNNVKVASSSTSGTTAAFNATGANFMAVCVTALGSAGTPAISDSSSNTWTASSTNPETVSGTTSEIYVFYATNASVSSTETVTATFGTATVFSLIAGSWSGRATSAPIDAQVGATETATTTTHTAAATGALAISGDDLVGCIADNGFSGGGQSTETWTASGSWTLPSAMTQSDARFTPTAGIEYQDAVSTSSVSETWGTNVSTIGAGIVLAIKPAGVPATQKGGMFFGDARDPKINDTLAMLMPLDRAGTPDCSSVDYYQPHGGKCGVN